jgi:hypothetical protein
MVPLAAQYAASENGGQTLPDYCVWKANETFRQAGCRARLHWLHTAQPVAPCNKKTRVASYPWHTVNLKSKIQNPKSKI